MHRLNRDQRSLEAVSVDMRAARLYKLALAVLHEREPVSVEADRQFFFGVSQIWCGSMRPEMARVRVRTDPHSPAKYRVNGPLSNMPEFAKAFSCQPGDTMVRPEEKRCAVW